MRFSTVFNLAAISIAASLIGAGCGGGGHVSNPVTTTRQINGFEIALTARDSYRRGETITFTTSLKNTEAAPVTIEYSSSLSDFTVSNNSQEIWNSSWGEQNLPALLTRILAPGEAVVFTDTWDQKDYAQQAPVPAGLYSVVARHRFRVSGSPNPFVTDYYSFPIAFRIE